MIVYLAGNVTVPREKMLISLGADHRLFSFAYHGRGGEFEEEFVYRVKQIEKIREEENE